MIENAEDLAQKAQDNKAGLKKQYVNIPIGDEEYGFRISGIGAKSVKLEKFIKYDEIFDAIEAGNDKYVNNLLKEYDRLIVETKTKLVMTKYNIIEVKSFTELLDVRDNLKEPIIYYNVIEHIEGIFYIKSDDDIYLLTVKNKDLEN